MRHLKQSFFSHIIETAEALLLIAENYKDVSFRFAKMNIDNFILLYVH